MDNSSSSDSSSDNNRIGHKCWYRERVNRQWTLYRRGILRMWGTDYEEFENGPGPYPVGVIEDIETKAMTSIHVCYMTFADEKPAE